MPTLHKISALLGTDDLAQIHELLAHARLVDGRLSAGAQAARNKRNREVAKDDATLKRLNEIIMPKLIANPAYRAIAMPCKIAEPYYVEYRAGDYYGEHTDNPIMGQAPYLYRCDIAMTIFLNHPHEYSGGELLIGTLHGEETQRVKYAAGDAVLYPATTAHRVTELTSGRRLVAVT